MVTLVLHTLREGQAAGFVLTSALARTEDSEGLDGASGGGGAGSWQPELTSYPALLSQWQRLTRVVTRETVGPALNSPACTQGGRVLLHSNLGR